MNKNTLEITTIGAVLIILIGASRADSHKNQLPDAPTLTNNSTQGASTNTTTSIPTYNNYSIGTVYASYDIYENAEELESYADLIVVGKTNQDFEQGQSVVFKNPLSKRGLGISGFYTLTPFEVKKVLKGSIAQPQIPVAQAAALIDIPNQEQKKLLKIDGYTLLKKNSSYLLYLKQMREPGRYSIVSVNQGKFNIDKTDKEEEALSEKDKQYRDLKSQVLQKNKSKLE